jgi:hypothetical protein
MRTSLVMLSLLLACSKSSSDHGSGSAAPVGSGGSSGSSAAPAGSGSSEDEKPAEAATVMGATKSAKGTLEVSGLMSGAYQWIKKDQKAPISCAWDPEKEIGGISVDLSDGAGHLIKVTVDAPPAELGVPRLDVTSKDLVTPLKTKRGFNMSGDGEGNIEVKIDSTLTADGTEADAAPAKKGGKQEAKPSGPSLTIKGQRHARGHLSQEEVMAPEPGVAVRAASSIRIRCW